MNINQESISEYGNSLNINQERIRQLKAIFPEVFSEDIINFKKLKDILGNSISSQRDFYELLWAGKSEARAKIQKQTTSTLTPIRESSIDFDKTENVFIEGENLEVLRVLQKSYFGKIKMIYIDPPYNTGNDSFVYPDDYSENRVEYGKRAGLRDSDGSLRQFDMYKNTRESGQFHSAWLSMMYPRLFLSRNLLKEDGVIFISIDDNEFNNLKLMCDEIFGEENFVANMVWQSKSGGGHDEKTIVKECEYILVYAKNKEITRFGRHKIENLNYKLEDKYVAIRGKYLLNKLDRMMRAEHYSNALNYPIKSPDGEDIWAGGGETKSSDWNWRWSETKFEWGIKNDFLEIKKGSNGKWAVYSKQYELVDNNCNPIDRLYPYRSFMSSSQFNTTQGGIEIFNILNGNIFDYSKPSKMISQLLKIGDTKENDIILDFFVGSGTTAQSVFETNKEDGANRKFIVVQLDEPTDKKSEAFKAGYKNIADITQARIKKVIKKIKSQKEGKLDFNTKQDLGYRSYRLSESNFRAWRSDVAIEDLETQLEVFQDPIAEMARTQESIITELCLKAGLPLTISVESLKVGGCSIFKINNGNIWVALEKVSQELIDLATEQRPKTFLTISTLFTGKKADELMTNAHLQLRDSGVDFKVI